MGICLVVLMIVAAIAIPNLMKAKQAANEASAYSAVKTIARAQYNYQASTGFGRFSDLQTLGKEELLAPDLAAGNKDGYVFSSTPINVEGVRPMFDLTARPKSTGRFGTGNTSYYSNETYIVYEADGGEPPSATPQFRVPEQGRPVK